MADQLTADQDADWMGKVFDAFLTPVLPDVFGVTPPHIAAGVQAAQDVSAGAGQAVIDTGDALRRAARDLADEAARAAKDAAWQIAAWGGVALVAYVAIQKLERR